MTVEKLSKIFLDATDDKIIDFVEAWEEFSHDFGVIENRHENMLLTTVLHEVGSSLISRRENLNYTPSALRGTFSRYMKNHQWSERDGRTEEHKANQLNIGNIAYADRIGNGPIDSGDGYRFRGGGYIQTTGRYNWEQAAKTIRMLTGESIDAEYLERGCDTVAVGVLMLFAFSFENNIAECLDMDCCTDKVNKYTKSREARNNDYERISLL